MTASTMTDRAVDRRPFGWSLFLALIPGTIFLLIFFLRASRVVDGVRTFTLFDDALISMSYGRTLATTGDWVWFPDAERVQGFTNPLWSLYMALIHATGMNGNAAVIAISVTGIVIVLICAITVGVTLHRSLVTVPSRGVAALVGAGLVPFLLPLTFWSVRGMEVGLLALLSLVLVLGVLLALRSEGSESRRHRGTVLVVLTTVVGVATRLDFAVVVAAVCLAGAALAGKGRVRWSILLAGVISLAATALVVLAFQRGYWGDWLPNTYRLKAEGFTLVDRLSRGVATAGKALPLLVLVGFAVLLVVRSGTRTSRYAALLAGSVVLSTAAYSIWVGGDAWEWSGMVNRYISVGLPAATITVLLAAATAITQPLSPRKAIVPLALLTLSGLAYGLGSNPLALNRGIAVGLFALLAIGSIGVVLALRRLARQDSRGARLSVALMTGVLLLTSVSAVPTYLWARGELLFIDTDQQITAESKALTVITTPQAVIATAWGGAPGYYSERPMVDLLGKSDRFIAGTAPKRELYPGHDKWDYAHSIRDQRPDVVRELFFESSDDIANMAAWGYVVRCFDDQQAYFLESSNEVIWSQLRVC